MDLSAFYFSNPSSCRIDMRPSSNRLRSTRFLTIPFVMLVAASFVNADIISFGLRSSARARTTQFLKKGKLAEARKEILKTTSADPDSPHPELVLANLMLQNGDLKKGISILEAVAMKEPKRFDIRLAFCTLALQQGRWFDCWTHIGRCESAIMPESWSEKRRNLARYELLSLKARCCEGRRDWSQAKTIYESLAAKQQEGLSDKVRFEALRGVGRSLFHLGKIDSCYQCFVSLCKEDPGMGPSEIMIAQLYDGQGKLDDAENWFEKAVEQSPEKSRLPFARWLIWNNRPEKVNLLLANEKLESLSVKNQEEAGYLRVLALRMLRKYASARKILEPLFEKNPGSHSLANQMALILLEDTDSRQQSRALNLALDNTVRYPTHPESWATLGWIQLRLGDTAQAQKNLRRSIAGGKMSRDAAHYLAKLSEKLGNQVKAREFSQAAQNAQGPFFYSYDSRESR